MSGIKDWDSPVVAGVEVANKLAGVKLNMRLSKRVKE